MLPDVAAWMSEDVGNLLHCKGSLMCSNAILQIPSEYQHKQVHPVYMLAKMGPERVRPLYAGQIC